MNSFETLQRNPFKPLIRAFFFAFALFFALSNLSATGAFAAQANLSWNPTTTYTDGTPITNLGGYKVYTGTASGNYSQNVDVGNVTSYTLGNLNDGTTYFFAVKAYDASGDVSGFSNQVSFTTSTAPSTSLFTITASAGSGGSISPSGSVAISQGLSQTYTITASTGYKIAGVTVDGALVGAVSGYTFTNVTANHSIAATFAPNTTSNFTITASTGTGGSITPAGATTVSSGASQAYTVTPSTGYYTASVSVDGAVVASNLGTYSYTFSNIAANHTISATFAVATYTITASAGTNGSISPTGTTYVNYGTSKTYTITPAAGYKIAGVTVDGASVGTLSSYTFTNVTAKHTIAATFAPNTTTSFTITASAGTGGSITPAGTTTVGSGASQAFTVTPSAGYYTVSISVDGAVVASNLGTYSYTFSNIAANHTISATFAVTTYAITASAGTNGSISPTGTTSVAYGTSKTYTITPAAGYSIAGVAVDGASVGVVSSYTFTNVTANHTIAATFAPTATTSFTITASAGTNGSITPAGTTSVSSGGSQSYTITPLKGHKVKNVIVDGISVGAVKSYVFSGIKANHTIQASFR